MKSRRFMLTLAVMASLSFSGCGGGGSSTPPPPTTYTVGGTVSGLSGTGLALRDNGSDRLQINANGNFTFAIPVANGGTYNVTVSTQPSNPLQLCVVANGSGTANANVASVQVTCKIAYTIGGTVSGLSGTGPVLEDNVGDDQPINANGNFTFATPIPSGGTYYVAVSVPPSNPVQFCTVLNGSGTAVGNVTNIQITCTTPAEQVLYAFGGTPDGNFPAANMVFDSSGNLYGATVNGGAYGEGMVFKLTPNQGQWTESVIHSFCQPPDCADGKTPQSGLIFDAAGNLYGTTNFVVFELAPNPDGTWAETVLHTFGGGSDGSVPSSGLILDNGGNFYGTTIGGGTGGPSCNGGCGTVFELSPGTNGQWTEQILYNFCSHENCVDGVGPVGGVVFDSAGNLYRATSSGGNGGGACIGVSCGTVFELIPAQNGQWTETVLYSFQGGSTDGYDPLGVVLDKSGNLYGTTEWGDETGGGATGNNGTVFALTRGQNGQWTESIIHPFCSDLVNCSDGSHPLAGLVFDKAGNLYGTAEEGAIPNGGVVFVLTPNGNGTWTETPLYTFQGGADGDRPAASVILDAEGNVYGVTSGGGAKGYGVVFEVTP